MCDIEICAVKHEKMCRVMVFCSQDVRNCGFTKTRKSRLSQGLAGAMYSITGAESIRAGDAEVSSGVAETCSITGAGGQVNRAGVSHSITRRGRLKFNRCRCRRHVVSHKRRCSRGENKCGRLVSRQRVVKTFFLRVHVGPGTRLRTSVDIQYNLSLR